MEANREMTIRMYCEPLGGVIGTPYLCEENHWIGLWHGSGGYMTENQEFVRIDYAVPSREMEFRYLQETDYNVNLFKSMVREWQTIAPEKLLELLFVFRLIRYPSKRLRNTNGRS